MEDAKSMVLNFLREFRSERVLFKMDEALKKLNISRSELEEALFALEDEGYLTILRIPPSGRVIERLKARLSELDVLYVLGEMEEAEYIRRWKDVADVTSSEELKDLKPLPSQNLPELLKTLRASCDHLEKLEKERDKVDERVYRELLNTYIGDLLTLAKFLKKFAESSYNALSRVKRDLERLRIETEKLMLDSKIKGVDHRPELEDLERRAEVILGRAQRLAARVGFPLQFDDKTKESEALLKRYLEELNRIESSLRIIKARARIEGEERYRDEISRLERSAQDLRVRVEALRKELEKPSDTGCDVLRGLESIKEKLQNLPFENVRGEVYQLVSEAVELITSVHQALQKVINVSKQDEAFPYNLSKLLSALVELPSNSLI